MAKKILKIIVYIFACIGFVLVMTYLAVELGLTKTKGIIDTQHDFFKNQMKSGSSSPLETPDPSDTWNKGEEWQTLHDAIQKDTVPILKASKEAGISPRIVVSILVVEQLRLFHSNRELFKQVFAPLKILAIQSQFSWGVMGVKQDTAREVEAYLKDPTSPWYLGKEYEHILDFTTSDPDTERFDRLTNEHDRYYSYLYAAIIAKQLITQWDKASTSIKDRPDIIATLYDIGFEHSSPHPNPESGGAEIEVGGKSYSFGSLAKKFYESDELVTEFSR